MTHLKEHVALRHKYGGFFIVDETLFPKVSDYSELAAAVLDHHGAARKDLIGPQRIAGAGYGLHAFCPPAVCSMASAGLEWR